MDAAFFDGPRVSLAQHGTANRALARVAVLAHNLGCSRWPLPARRLHYAKRSPLWACAWLHIMRNGYGLPQMGVAGAAMTAIWMAQGFRLKYVAHGWWRRERFARLLHIGYPAGVEVLVFQAGYFVFLMMIGHFYGTIAFAAYNVGSSLLMVCFVVGFGFSIAGSTLAGQHLGARDPDGAVRSGWRSAGYAVASMGTIGLAVAVFAPELAVFFLGDDEETVRLTVQMAYIMAAMTPLMAIEFAIGGALRGAGDTRFPLVATAVGLLGARCTLAAAFTFLGWPVVWVYGAMIVECIVKGAMLLARFRSDRWKTAGALDQERAALA